MYPHLCTLLLPAACMHYIVAVSVHLRTPVHALTQSWLVGIVDRQDVFRGSTKVNKCCCCCCCCCCCSCWCCYCCCCCCCSCWSCYWCCCCCSCWSWYCCCCCCSCWRCCCCSCWRCCCCCCCLRMHGRQCWLCCKFICYCCAVFVFYFSVCSPRFIFYILFLLV